MPYKILALVAAALLLIALVPLAHRYDTLLRIVVCGVAVYGVVVAVGEGRTAWAVALGVLAVLFNPFLQIPLEGAVGAVLHVVGAALLLGSTRRVGALLES
jgi:hypothetical protein